MNDQEMTFTNLLDMDGNPAGGTVEAEGLIIRWQDGPLGRGVGRKIPNGAFVETVLRAAQQRLAFYQEDDKFNCDHNQWAMQCIDEALRHLGRRTEEREDRGVEGTHEA